jgi:pimeloyl-ACP methyl ester carboxylesterase
VAAPQGAASPVAVTLGGAGTRRTAIVLGPVMARWDGGASLGRVLPALLTTGHRVTVYDTLSLLERGDDLAALTAGWERVIAEGGPVDVLLGNALGGAVVQCLLDRPWARSATAVLLSAPTVADAELNAAQERVASAVASHGLAAALGLLEEVVRGPVARPRSAARAAPAVPEQRRAQQAVADERSAGRRLAAGLRLLHGLDARRTVEAFPGRLLHLYGDQSRLVRRHHLAAGPGHHLLGIPGAGMRPHADQPNLTRRALARFLEAEDE